MPMKSRWPILSILIMLLIASVNLLHSAEFEETIKKQFVVAKEADLNIRNVNGSVQIETWDHAKIEVVAHKSAHGSNSGKVKKYFENIEVRFKHRGDQILVETHLPKKGGNGFFDWLFGENLSGSVDYEIRIPHQSDLDIKTTNGKIMVSGVEGVVRLKSTNGAIVGENISGQVEAKTTNGSIKIALKSVMPGSDLGFYTTNGGIRLYLPEDLSCSISAKTTNGSIHSDFEIITHGKIKSNHLRGKIGEGGGLLELRTVNGSIKLLKNKL